MRSPHKRQARIQMGFCLKETDDRLRPDRKAIFAFFYQSNQPMENINLNINTARSTDSLPRTFINPLAPAPSTLRACCHLNFNFNKQLVASTPDRNINER